MEVLQTTRSFFDPARDFLSNIANFASRLTRLLGAGLLSFVQRGETRSAMEADLQRDARERPAAADNSRISEQPLKGILQRGGLEGDDRSPSPNGSRTRVHGLL